MAGSRCRPTTNRAAVYDVVRDLVDAVATVNATALLKVTHMDEEPKDGLVYWMIAIVGIPIVVFFIVMLWVSPGRTTEYSMIPRDAIVHCDQFAKAAATTVAGMVKAYGDCIRVLPHRLEIPKPAGTVPATGETWSEACEREYRTWDKATGTVVRRGSPDRVECPLVLKDGEWIIPNPQEN